MDNDQVSIYVLPTEPLKPPKAFVGEILDDNDGNQRLGFGMELQWSRDLGQWICTNCGLPHIPPDMQEAITEHARELGVEW